MSAKKKVNEAKGPLAKNTIAFQCLRQLYEHKTLKPAALHHLMPDRRQNTATVHVYLQRLENLGYAYVNCVDDITITAAGIKYMENKPEAPTPKYLGIPAASRSVSIWTPEMRGYDKRMREGRRAA